MLKELYKTAGVPDKEQLVTEKDILLVVPDKDFDVVPVLGALGVVRQEVAVTWPKQGLDMMAEIAEVAPKLVLQVGERVSQEFPFVPDAESVGDDLRYRVSEVTPDAFVGLHHHDEFSIKDGLGTVEGLVKLLTAQRRSFCCVTNHGSVGGWIRQYNICKKAGIKAIFGCLIPDQPIVTKMGVKRIQDVIVGDEVLTHQGRFRKVLMTSEREYEGRIYSPEFWGNGDCWVTEEHPFLCYVGGTGMVRSRNTRNDAYDWDYQFRWVKASDICPRHIKTRRTNAACRKAEVPVKGRWTHYAVVPRVATKMNSVIDLLDFIGDGYVSDDSGFLFKRTKTSWYKSVRPYAIRRMIDLDEEWMRFFGLYISEGSNHNGVVRWTFNLETDCDAINFVRRFCLARMGLDLKFAGYVDRGNGPGKAADFYVCDMALQKAFVGMFGNGAKNKRFPACWLMLPSNLLMALLGGIWEGDANRRSGCLRTASWSLAHLCRIALVKVTGQACRVSDVDNGGKMAYDLKWTDDNAGHHRTDCDKDYSYLPIRSMKSMGYRGLVYNLEVEEDNSYVSGVAVHNCEVYVSNYRGDDMEQKKAHRSANHLVLLARTKEGFDNIIRIHNDAQLNGFYYTPRTTWESLEKWGKGIIASSACMAGELPQLLMNEEYEQAKELWAYYASIFDGFYIEVQIIEFEQQREVNRRLIRFAQDVGAPLLLTCDSHYLDKEHADTHDLLMCIRQGKTVLDRADEKEDVWDFDVRNLYYRNADQMWDVFANGFVEKDGTRRPPFMDDVFTQEVFLGALANTRAVAQGMDDIKLDSSIKLPKLYDDGQSVLRKKVNAGFTARGLGKKENSDEYRARARYEFGVITRLGWTDYFLIMEKIISDTRAKFGEWAVGYGRGSAAGSLVSYCLGLTDVDPLQYGLLFERFLDEGRPDPPDIDTDFDPRVREWVKKHIVESFGSDNVCSIGTYQTYRTRAVILDVARALALDLGEAANVTKCIDPLKSFADEDGEDTKVDKLDFDELCEHYKELKDYFEAHPEVRHHAEILRNQVKNMGMHAGGVIISDASLKDRIPVLWDKAANEERQVISAWAESGTASELSSVGLVKYDILGLNNLPVISDCIKLIEKTQGRRIARADIPIDDRDAILFGSKKDLVGIFQLENPSMKGVMDEVRMESLEDVAAVTSLIRPGPMDATIDGEKVPMVYAHRKHGQAYVVHPLLREVLGPTYGLLVYQEQVMAISRVLAGFTAPEANKLRKAMGKKLKDLMTEMKVKFFKGAQARIDAGEITAEEVQDIFSQMETFAGYGFNKSHAITYSAISTCELWLKYHYPVEFCTALINNTKLGKKKHGSEDILVDYVNYARRNNIVVLGPDVNASEEEFVIENGAIRFSIGHIKNIASAAATIVAHRPYVSMADFYERVKVETTGDSGKVTSRRPNRKVVESLIAAGAFDSFGTRNEMMAEYYRLRKEKEAPKALSDARWVAQEKEMIGLCLSQPPLYKQHEALIRQNKWKLVSEVDEGKRIMVFGKIESIRTHTSKAGNQMYIVKLSDGMDEMSFMVFTSSMEYFRDNVKTGYVAAIPLDKFDDGDTRFFDERGRIEVVEK